MKTVEEKQFDALLDEYFDKFGKNYPLDVTSTLSTQEHKERLRNALRDNKAVPEEKNEPNVDY